VHFASALARAPLTRGSTGTELAAATGFPVEYGEAGQSTIVFAPGRVQREPAPPVRRVLSRQEDGEGAGSAVDVGSESAEAVATATPAAAAAPGGGDGAQSIDEIYDKVVDRLRRDILVERERMGDLLGDLL